MKTLATSGLLSLAQKYTAKTLNLRPNVVKVCNKNRRIILTCKTASIARQRVQALVRVLKSKGFNTLKLNIDENKQNSSTKTTLQLELSLIKRTRKPRKHRVAAGTRKTNMLREQLLANSLAQGMRYQLATASLHKQLIREAGDKVEADAGGLGLKVMRHGDGARLVQTIYQDYVSDKDYTGFLDFFKDVDDMLYKFRGNKELDLNSLQEDDDDAPRRGKGKRGGRKSFAPKGGSPVRSKQPSEEAPSTDPSDQSVVISTDKLNSERQRDKIKNMLNKYYG